MAGRAVLCLMLTLLFLGIFVSASNIQAVKAEPTIWTVDDDGPADFSSIQEAVDSPNVENGDTIFVYSGVYNEYVNVSKSLELIGEDRDTTVIDGRGIENQPEIVHVSADNVTIRGFTIINASIEAGYYSCLDVVGSSCLIIDNIISSNIPIYYAYGIALGGQYNVVAGNIINGSFRDIVGGGYQNTICRNEIGNILATGQNNTITGNQIDFIWFMFEEYTTVTCNTIGGFDFMTSSSNNCVIYHNNVIWSDPIYYPPAYPHLWDDGYPSGGNYWTDYAGDDTYSGPYQNVTGSDGIGDTPFIISDYNRDNYPLMTPYTPTYDIAIIDITAKTIVGQGYPMPIELTIENQGESAEFFYIDIYANSTSIVDSGPMALAAGKQKTLTLLADTTHLAKGNYTITASIPPVQDEIDTLDNTIDDAQILVTIPGDVNGDDVVDMGDISLLIEKFLLSPSDPLWNPNCDVNSDNVIDMADITIAIDNFLKP
jgi:hypothetical protein